jgi:hypothetical protein
MHRPYLDGSELRPLLHALIDWHPDLLFLRNTPSAREGYILVVLTAIFASIHGQRPPCMSFADVSTTNLADALGVGGGGVVEALVATFYHFWHPNRYVPRDYRAVGGSRGGVS